MEKEDEEREHQEDKKKSNLKFQEEVEGIETLQKTRC